MIQSGTTGCPKILQFTVADQEESCTLHGANPILDSSTVCLHR